MPIYEYECGACGHRLEAFQKISEDPLQNCPICHQSALNKLVSAAGFQLKGTGWYATDFKDKGKPKSTEKSTETTTGTDTKPKDDKSSGTTTSGDTK